MFLHFRGARRHIILGGFYKAINHLLGALDSHLSLFLFTSLKDLFYSNLDFNILFNCIYFL